MEFGSEKASVNVFREICADIYRQRSGLEPKRYEFRGFSKRGNVIVYDRVRNVVGEVPARLLEQHCQDATETLVFRPVELERYGWHVMVFRKVVSGKVVEVTVVSRDGSIYWLDLRPFLGAEDLREVRSLGLDDFPGVDWDVFEREFLRSPLEWLREHEPEIYRAIKGDVIEVDGEEFRRRLLGSV